MREKFQSKQTVNAVKKINAVPKATKLYNNEKTFVSLIYTFSLARNIMVYTPIQGTNRENYINHFIYKGKTGKKHPSVHLFLHRLRTFQLSTEKNGSNPSEWDIKMFIPAPTQ